ncbi:hypothetical protein KBZ19_12540 [Synechococcus sp. L2F]|uniref:hypothetical protein n=1 Tax=Synechococcus sp. L2F TaxID=2823739 RepID=UPI0020CDC6E1|nr:hypothetical protein [Synechococcus sp. L2F]MCP9829313.1 hypothetical protein [Synechococcus sp. L2F]
MTMHDQLIRILSRHRGEVDRHYPRPLPLHVITQLLQQEEAPDKPAPDQSALIETLHELEAKGEIVSGPGKCFCMAPPSLVIEADSMLNARFLGDRAYLAAVHQHLDSSIEAEDCCLNSPLDPAQARQRLARVGVSLKTWDDLLRALPSPTTPSPLALRHASWNRDPFQLFDWIEHYKPSTATTQPHRWLELFHAEDVSSHLLRLPDHTLLWKIENLFYEITPDVAVLAMFALDREDGRPLLIPWQEATGILDLREIQLPAAYARLLWALSEPAPETWRSRIVRARNRPLVRAALNRLGLEI